LRIPSIAQNGFSFFSTKAFSCKKFKAQPLSIKIFLKTEFAKELSDASFQPSFTLASNQITVLSLKPLYYNLISILIKHKLATISGSSSK